MNPNGEGDIGTRERGRYLFAKESAAVLLIIILLNALPAFATDMYLAALPDMAIEFNSPESLLNLNLILFFLFYAIGLLIWGPLSDRYGRRSTLVIGMIAFVIFSILCGLSTGVYKLILFRVLQGIFGGVGVSVSTAMVKDIYEGHKRERVFAMVAMMMAIGPIVAPIAGAALLQVITWNGIFYIIALLGAIALVGCALMEEPIPQRSGRRVISAMVQPFMILKNRRFSNLLPSFTPLGVTVFIWVGVASYILIGDFGLSQGEFSLYFAANAVTFLIGPFLWIVRKVAKIKIITTCLLAVIVSGALLITIGELAPMALLVAVIPASLAGSTLRTPSLDISLAQVDEDVGAASSIFNFLFMAIGAGGMMIASMDWDSRIMVMGVIYLLVGVFTLISWLRVKSDYTTVVKEGPVEQPSSAEVD
jgi:DHA1 family bicyclomycin/chloramphenicol resistance-like MFS transporter